MKASEVLRTAIKLIRKNGWAKHTMVDPKTGCMCAEGALAVAGGHVDEDGVPLYSDNGEPSRAYLDAMEALRVDVATPSYPEVYNWNDKQRYATGRKTVLLQMGKTARRLEREEAQA